MTARFPRMLTVMGFAATTLTACAALESTADGLWDRTRSVAGFVSAPVRKLLRDAPERAAPAKAGTATDARAFSVAEAGSDTVVTVQTAQVEMFRSVEILETVRVGPLAMDVMTVDGVSYVRLDGAALLEDWRDCEAGALDADAKTFEHCMKARGYRPDAAAIVSSGLP
ncbi:hypothetical protein [uncultured Algimonas sp.]|uniref:hypothetical protein n=1 Tax=uncultured Algimonas sp. TaxID=1547920 RepID=UPI00260B0FAF|nr:hypothetical protein [uncultured Algimonas sp.]